MSRYPPPPPRPPGEPALVSAKGLAVFLDCHTHSVYRWLRKGWIIEGVYSVGPRMLRFDRILVLHQIQKAQPHRYPH